ncbi:MAG: hypothetical protein ABW185_03030 [Sedimenticola sp.]
MNSKKEDVISNPQNKQMFINLLSETICQDGIEIKHAPGDADVLIVQTAVACSTTASTVVVGEDTDLLILLCYHTRPGEGYDIYFKPESKMGTKKQQRCWDIKMTQRVLGGDVCSHMLFVHAVLGCDTTSRAHGIGKGVALKQLMCNSAFKEQAGIFLKGSSTVADVVEAGEKALICLYNGKTDESLDTLRLQRFYHKVKLSSSVQLQSLPPTSAATQYHSMRVYHQVQEWQGNELPPDEWGWKIHGPHFMPIMTTKEVAPKSLLSIISCNCKSGCSTMRCSCRKAGLECSPGCGECRGLCRNASQSETDGNDSLD